MSYSDWPSTIATRSSSAWVALISILFIVWRPSRIPARDGAVGRFASGDSSESRRAPGSGGTPGFPALRHHGGPRERLFVLFRPFWAGVAPRPWPGRRAGHLFSAGV